MPILSTVLCTLYCIEYRTLNRYSMSSTHIELIRLKHELCEKYEIAIGEELDSKPSGV